MKAQKPLEIIERKNNERWKNWLPAEKAIMTRYYEKKGGKGVKKYLPNKSLQQIYDYAAGNGLKSTKTKKHSGYSKKTWNVKQVETLVKMFPNHTYKEIGIELGKSKDEVFRKAKSLGLSKQTQKPLTELEKKIIKEFYPYEGIEVMKRLPKDRLKNTVQRFVRMNGLVTSQLRSYQVDNVELTVMKKMYDEGYDHSYIASVTGYCSGTVRKKLALVEKMEKLKEVSGTTWSESEEQTITAMFESGAPISKCADVISRTEGAVTQKARKMGLM